MKYVATVVLVLASVGVSAKEACTPQLELEAQEAAYFIEQLESNPAPVCPEKTIFRCEEDVEVEIERYYQALKEWLAQYKTACGDLKIPKG